MPRDRDGDVYESADRRGGSSGTKTVFIVLGVLGGLALLTVLACAGLIGFGMFTFQKQMGGMIGSTTAGEAFLDDLKGGRVDAAYASTSAAYKTTMSRKQFDDFIAKEPLLKTNAFHSTRTANLPMGGNPTPPTATISYVLHASGNNVMEDDDPNAKPKKPDEKVPAEKGPQSVVVTLTLIEEKGQWVVDKFTTP